MSSTLWYHGTETPQFAEWICPPPRKSEIDVAHSAIFFTRNEMFARRAGPNVASVQLQQKANVVQPARPGKQSTRLRKELLKGCDLAVHNRFVGSDKDWQAAWRSGAIMRFEFIESDRRAQAAVHLHLNKSKRLLQSVLPEEISSQLSSEKWSQLVIQNFTRGWIEELIRAARRCGFQAVQGAEIDRHSGEIPPPARSWLAVLDTTILSKPSWIDRL